MRRIDPGRFRVATQGTSREINRLIALNLVRAHQPISRADLARTMGVGRGAVTLIVTDLPTRSSSSKGPSPTFRVRTDFLLSIHAAARWRGHPSTRPRILARPGKRSVRDRFPHPGSEAAS